MTFVICFYTHAGVARIDDTMNLVRHNLSYQDVIDIDGCILWYKSVFAKLLVIARLHVRGSHWIGGCKYFFLTRTVIFIALITIRLVIGAREQTAIQGGLIHHYTVLHIETGICHNGNDRIYTCRNRITVGIFAKTRMNQWTLRIIEYMCHRVNTVIEIAHIYADRLFSHGTVAHGDTIAPNEAMIVAFNRDIRNHAIT
jgi:hypothetical protein